MTRRTFPPRKVTGAFLKTMGFEFIRPDAIASKWRKFADACKEANDIEEALFDALASNRRLTDALQAKNERLERIAEKGRESKSGSAVHLARIAEGLA